ncbi:MAG: helix-turn-helix transcriptional regulator [Pseudomonadota bacterium]
MDETNKLAHELILEIYDAAIEPQKWPDVLNRCCEFVGAMGAVVFEMNGTPDDPVLEVQNFSSGYDERIISSYLHAYQEQELVDQAILAAHSRRTDEIQLIRDDVLGSSREEVEAREHMQAMKAFGIKYRSGALLNKDIITHDRFSFQYTKTQGPMVGWREERCALIVPHIAKAMNVGRPTRQLAQHYSMVLDSLNRLAVGVCIIDARRNVIVTNMEFDRQAEEYEVFRIAGDGRLEFGSSKIMKTANDMFSSVAFHGRYGARPRKEALEAGTSEGSNELCIEIIPLSDTRRYDRRMGSGSIIFSLDTSRHTGIDIDKVGDLYELTGSERDVLKYMAEGLTNPQIADACNKSRETVNSQVKSILSKTMAANRTQLIRLAAQTSNFLVI